LKAGNKADFVNEKTSPFRFNEDGGIGPDVNFEKFEAVTREKKTFTRH